MTAADPTRFWPRCKHIEQDDDLDATVTLECTEKATHFSCCHPGEGLNACFAHRCRCRAQRMTPAKTEETK